ncbi:phosphotransferase [Gemmata sp. JC717]|uniref:phosphotransferase n=1 Tax=Gemmata algarum TaxID=2975278 RepID=UPI0028E09FCB|nr:phosphotransferase [Gemmata algarum]MDY3554976.1 phosphotransferase [Gemmata algarum]
MRLARWQFLLGPDPVALSCVRVTSSAQTNSKRLALRARCRWVTSAGGHRSTSVNASFNTQPSEAVAHFGPATAGLVWHPAPAGFSGAVVWRGDDLEGVPQVALKGWPLSTTLERVREVHSWLAPASALPFVPTVIRNTLGDTAVSAVGRVWDACRWLPGAPAPQPSEAETRAACEAVAQLHLACPAEPVKRPCAAVGARLRLLVDHQGLYAAGTILPPLAPQLDALLARAAAEIGRCADAAVEALRPWAAWPVRVRPCVRDLRREHVLFQSSAVTGIIDYGAMAIDTPAGDLARLLGDFAEADPALFEEGLSAYRRASGPLDVPDEFVRLLATTGTLCSLLGWLFRLFVRAEPVANPVTLAHRLTHLISRVSHLVHF